MMDNPPKNLYRKLNLIMSDKSVAFIKKDKKNVFHNYMYASEQAIKEAINPLLAEHKVLYLPVNVTSRIEKKVNQKIDSKGVTTITEEFLTILSYTYRFIDTETGEFIEGTFESYGLDNQDKGIYKAITGAVKYVLTSTFLIPTGEQNDVEFNNTPPLREERRPDPVDPRISEITALAKNRFKTKQEGQDWLRSNTNGKHGSLETLKTDAESIDKIYTILTTQ